MTVHGLNTLEHQPAKFMAMEGHYDSHPDGAPLIMLVLVWSFFRGLNDQKDLQPFLSALGFFTVSVIGIGISFYPMMVPPSLSIRDVAAPDSSLAFALVGTAVLIPVILGYTTYAYWVFRGKMDPSEGYHR